MTTAGGSHLNLSDTQSANPKNKSTKNLSYASIATKLSFPKKDQGLILECVDGLERNDYIYAIGDIVQPSNILFASRVSNDRICIYLSKKELVDNITDKYDKINIGKFNVNIRPLISKQQRVILSNVSPTIPHSIIEDALETLNINRGSNVSFLKAGCNKDGFTHVLSFRRQVYINPNDANKLPQFLPIDYDDTKYYIYPSLDSLKCFLCKKEGHIAKNCPTNLEPETAKASNTVNTTNNNTDNVSAIPETSQAENNNTLTLTQDITTSQIVNTSNSDATDTKVNLNSNKDNKRTHSDTSSQKSSQETDSDNFKIVQAKKKNKTDEDELDKKLKSVKEILDQPDKILNYTQFKSLLENVKKTKKPVDIVLQYTDNLKRFEAFIKNDIYPKVQDRSIKWRCTSLLNSIKNPNLATTPQPTPANSDDDIP